MLVVERVVAVKVSYVVLYVDDAAKCRRFWLDQVGMIEKRVVQAGEYAISRVGFPDQSFSFELVPLALMANNPDGLDLATPSVCFDVDDLTAARDDLIANGVEVTELATHAGMDTFAFSDPEGRWFAVTAA